MEVYRPCPLDLDKHDRVEFTCGEPSLDDWLRKYSGQNRRGNWAATWVIADIQHRVVAYASLSMTSLGRATAPRRLAKGAPQQVPALLLGRLGVDKSASRMGLGTALVKHVLATAVELNLQAACSAVIVTALSAGARDWWQRFGFTPFDASDATCFDLFLMTKDIESTLASL